MKRRRHQARAFTTEQTVFVMGPSASRTTLIATSKLVVTSNVGEQTGGDDNDDDDDVISVTSHDSVPSGILAIA